jgi:hypothetical protein
MLLRPFLFEPTSCASYLFGCTTHGKLAVVLGLPDEVLVYPSHYGGSVCGRALSSNPFSSMGFERRHNAMLRYPDADAFARELLVDLSPPPANRADILAENRCGRIARAA